MSRDRSLKASSTFSIMLAGVLMLVVLVASGVASKVGGRVISGLQLLGSGDTPASHVKDDTFSGRLGLAAERFSLAWSQNPLVGYGFIHEDDVPAELRGSLKYGTVLGGTAADPTAFSRFAEDGHYVLGLYSADIAWADIVVCTGWVGVVLFGAIVLTFVIERSRSRGAIHPMGYAVQTGLYLQLAMMFVLMFDGNSFYSVMHIPALLLAGYSLTRFKPSEATANPNVATSRTRPANLMA